MTAKERILTALAGGKPDLPPVAIDYMSLYLAERTERAYVELYRERLEREGRVQIDPDEDLHIRAQATLKAYDCFQERHDWLVARGAPLPETLRQRELLLEDGTVFEIDHSLRDGTRRPMLRSGEETKTQEMQARFEQIRSTHATSQNIAQIMADHRDNYRASYGDQRLVEALAQAKGQEYFVYTGAAAPFVALYNVIGFENMMTAMHDTPQLLFTMMEHLLEMTLEQARAFKEAGGHGIRIEECFASADIISPAAYERFALPYEERLFQELRRMGLKSILYFCGDVLPRLPALRCLPIDALMVEESKKNFVIDIEAVRAGVGPQLCLLGNIDVYEVIFKGSDAELAAEVARQIRVAGAEGAFIVGVGSPITLDTPPERLDQLIRYARANGAASYEP